MIREGRNREMDDKRQVVEFVESRCAVCYVPIPQVRGGRLRRTCSAACRQKLYRLRKGKAARKRKGKAATAPAKRPKKTCPVCGEPLVQPATGRKRKTCSERCRKQLWRRQHPRCLMCGKRFTMVKYQKERKYCSKHCRWRGLKLRQRQAQREKAIAEAALHRPDWLPRPGEGYRAERIPWEGSEDEAVIRKRRPRPYYRMSEEEKEAKRREEEAREEAEWEARVAAYEAEARKKQAAEQMAHDLLLDEWKWREW
jgi:predicted nucleic acid-binding Zn ribbon protein